MNGASSFENVSAKIVMSLFDKQIVPILLYNSAVWGIPFSHTIFPYLDTGSMTSSYKAGMQK